MPKPITQNTLFYWDNLPILRERFPADMPKYVLRQTFKQQRRSRGRKGSKASWVYKVVVSQVTVTSEVTVSFYFSLFP